jgi:hypothetical protein
VINDGPTALELKEIRNRAERILLERGLAHLPVDPIELATKEGIHVFANPDTEEGVSGMLAKVGET